MATRTAVASGLWSAAGTWDTGVPVNGDTVVIPVSFDVEFDVDQSGFAAGITLTITGTLHASTTAGSYILKLQANMAGAGTLRAGTEATPYPTNCTFTIQRNGFSLASTTMTYDLNCTEPTIKWCKLTAIEAAAQTVWSVDTDVTADPRWVSGAILRIVDVNFGVDTEERIFSSATSNTITVTAGLTAQKESGAYVVLMSRNVRITHTATTGDAVLSPRLGRIFAEIYMAATGINDGRSIKVGGAIHGTSARGLSSVAGQLGSLEVSAVIAGTGTNAVSGASGCTFLSTAFLGGATSVVTGAFASTFFNIIAGGTSGASDSSVCLFYGSIIGCVNGINVGGGHQFTNATLQNTNDLTNTAAVRAFNTLFSGTTENSGYNGTTAGINSFSESINHDQVANAYRAWTKGGIVSDDTVTVFSGRTRSYKHACETALFPVFKQEKFVVQPGGGLIVQTYVRKTVTMAYLPRVWILEPDEEPLISGSPTSEAIMTDSVDTWETLVQVYSNSGTSPIAITVRTLAKNATGNVFFDPIITVLAPATYDVYNTLLGYVDSISLDLWNTLRATAFTADSMGEHVARFRNNRV